MWTDMLILMKQEMALIVLIFIIMFLKLGKDRSNESYMKIVNVLLLINLVAGFFWNREGMVRILFVHFFTSIGCLCILSNECHP